MKTQNAAADLLHDYQRGCVDALANFFSNARTMSVKAAFADSIPDNWHAAYWPVPEVELNPKTPYVCVKVPTGGGKTLIAAAAIGPVSHALRKTPPTVLWLAPTTAIVSQTLRALRENPRMYGELSRSMPDFETVAMPLSEAHRIRPRTLQNKAVVVVSTIQALRVADTEGRKFYEDSGTLMEHFKSMPDSILADLPHQEGEHPTYSLANVLRARNPMVIVDEAHGARSELSFKTLAGLAPACILEFTATPRLSGQDTVPSNVLHQASAYDLKRNNMIKSPIHVGGSNNWREAVRLAVKKREELDVVSQKEKTDFVPIVLFQAEKSRLRTERITAQVLRDMLIQNFDEISAEQVALAIGGGDELGDDIGMRKSPIRYVITVQKLAEGWDCPAAYVLCSVANINAPVAAEQILGRVLRLPGAKKQSEQLNAAHVFAARLGMRNVARAVVDALEKSHGFSRHDAKQMLGDETANFFDGNRTKENAVHSAAKENPLRIPRLMIRVHDKPELFEQSHLTLFEPWKKSALQTDLPGFSPEISTTSELVDVRGDGRLVRQQVQDFPRQIEERAMLFSSDQDWTLDRLVGWIARQARRPDVPYALMISFVRAALEGVKNTHGLDDSELIARRYILEKDIACRLDDHRLARQMRGFQKSLKGVLGGKQLETTTANALEISTRNYQPRELHVDTNFDKHVFPEKVGKFDTEEEEDCADYINSKLVQTEIWLRNLSSDDAYSFWLPTPTHLFYPDFIVRLKDGRILVVEYKGKNLWKDAEEKRQVGKLWEKCSNGKCIFVMVSMGIGEGLREIDIAVSRKGC